MKIECSFFSLLTDKNHIGIVKESVRLGISWPVTVVTHPSAGNRDNIVAVYKGDDHLFNYDLDADVVF